MTNLLVKLTWIVVTNWVPVHPSLQSTPAVYFYPPQSITSTANSGQETATLTSNLIMRVMYKKKPKEFTLESIPFLVTNRTWKMEKVFEGGGAQSYQGGHLLITNVWFGTIPPAFMIMTNANTRIVK